MNELWPFTFLLSSIAPLVQIILSFYVPESPSYLARGGFSESNLKEVVKVENILKGDSVDVNHLINIKSVKQFSLIDDFKGIWNDKYARIAAIQISIIFAASQLTGISSVFFYSITIFQSAGIPIEYAGVASLGLAVFLILGTVLALFVINKFGRLSLLNFSFAAMGFMCIIFTVLLSLSENEIVGYISMIPLFGYMLAFNLGPGPIPWLLASETVPTEFKAGVQAFGSASLFFWTFVIGLFFPVMQNSMEQYVFLVFAAMCGLSIVYIKFRCVETSGRSVDQVRYIYKIKFG